MLWNALLTAACLAATPALPDASTGAHGMVAAAGADLPSERDVWVGSRADLGSTSSGRVRSPGITVPEAIVSGERSASASPALAVGNDSGSTSAASSGRWVGAGLVIASLAFAAAWAHRRKIQLPSRQIKIVETVAVGPKRSMMLIEVDGERLLVGSSEAGLQVLSTRQASSVSSPVPGEASAPAERAPRTTTDDFQAMLTDELEADALRRKMAAAASEPTLPNLTAEGRS